MKINPYGGICIFCHNPKACEYVVHGKGKNTIVNYFHKECYEKMTIYSRKARKKNETV